MLFLNSVKDAFTNPDSPWYYAIGSVFLVLIIAAIVIYMVVTKKRGAKPDANESADTADTADGEKTDAADAPAQEEPAPDTASEKPDETTEEVKTAETSEGNSEEPEKTEPAPAAEPEHPAPEAPVETEAEKTEEVKEPEAAENKEPASEAAPAEKPKKAPAKKPASTAKKPATAAKKQAAMPVEEVKSEPESAPVEKAEAPAKKPAAAKKPTAKKAAEKPFIDRLIATKSAHGVYNELKNTVLSYPGMKAKLTKDDEQFFFGTDKKAAIVLDGANVTLKLSLERDKVPSQFAVVDGDGDLPTAMTVGETEIDAAQRLITFAMNVSLLTRNDRHRHTDYVQKAIEAKNRAKKK